MKISTNTKHVTDLSLFQVSQEGGAYLFISEMWTLLHVQYTYYIHKFIIVCLSFVGPFINKKPPKARSRWTPQINLVAFRTLHITSYSF